MIKLQLLDEQGNCCEDLLLDPPDELITEKNINDHVFYIHYEGGLCEVFNAEAALELVKENIQQNYNTRYIQIVQESLAKENFLGAWKSITLNEDFLGKSGLRSGWSNVGKAINADWDKPGTGQEVGKKAVQKVGNTIAKAGGDIKSAYQSGTGWKQKLGRGALEAGKKLVGGAGMLAGGAARGAVGLTGATGRALAHGVEDVGKSIKKGAEKKIDNGSLNPLRYAQKGIGHIIGTAGNRVKNALSSPENNTPVAPPKAPKAKKSKAPKKQSILSPAAFNPTP